MNSKFEGMEGSGRSLMPERRTVGSEGVSESSEHKEMPESAFDREEALRELREIALKDPVYDMDGNEIKRVGDIVNRSDPKDAFVLLKAAESAYNSYTRREIE